MRRHVRPEVLLWRCIGRLPHSSLARSELLPIDDRSKPIAVEPLFIPNTYNAHRKHHNMKAASCPLSGQAPQILQ
jgi:hypothetical protein